MHMLNSELQTLITSSSLVDFEQEIIAGALGRLDETFQETLATLCTEHIWLIPYLYINYAQKRYALEKGDTDLVRMVADRQLQPLEGLI